MEAASARPAPIFPRSRPVSEVVLEAVSVLCTMYRTGRANFCDFFERKQAKNREKIEVKEC